MGEFRDRMEQDLQIRGFSPSTQSCYLARMRAMVRFFMRPPDELTLEDIHAYQLHLSARVPVFRGRKLRVVSDAQAIPCSPEPARAGLPQHPRARDM